MLESNQFERMLRIFTVFILFFLFKKHFYKLYKEILRRNLSTFVKVNRPSQLRENCSAWLKLIEYKFSPR